MKERLTGAIILVALIVLLVPELLSGPKGRFAPAPAPTAGTSTEEPPLRSYTINLGDDSRSRATATGSSGPTATPQPNGIEQPTTPIASSTESGAQTPRGSPQAPRALTDPAAVPHSAANAAPGARSASQSGTGEQSPDVRQQASASGLPRVAQAGPLRPAAPVTARSRAPTPASPAPRPAPTTSSKSGTAGHPASSNVPRVASASSRKMDNASPKSESGWAVQLGVFRSRENAERLATDVRTKGFKASVSPITVGREKRYKVRVGPASDRTAAQELQGRLKASGHPGGAIVPII